MECGWRERSEGRSDKRRKLRHGTAGAVVGSVSRSSATLKQEMGVETWDVMKVSATWSEIRPRVLQASPLRYLI